MECFADSNKIKPGTYSSGEETREHEGDGKYLTFLITEDEYFCF